MIKFRMDHTLLMFVDKYYKCGVSENILDRGIMMSRYELAWLADLVAAYILDNAKYLFTNTTHDYGIYRDDEIILFKGKWNKDNISNWVKTFQLKVNDLTNSENLQFMTEIWEPCKNKTKEPI